jgi:hypothetical protein
LLCLDLAAGIELQHGDAGCCDAGRDGAAED